MPQPVPRNRPLSFDFNRSAVLARPKQAAYIASILMHWNEIEARVGIFLAALLGGGEAQTVIKLFLALQTDGGRRAVIDTVTGLKLLPDDLMIFQEIQREIGNRYSERNKVVHGAWGTSPEYPNELLWYDPRESVAAFPEFMKAAEPGEPARDSILDRMNKSIRVYTDKDFLDMLERFESCYTKLKTFTTPYVDPVLTKLGLVLRPPKASPPAGLPEGIDPSGNQKSS